MFFLPFHNIPSHFFLMKAAMCVSFFLLWCSVLKAGIQAAVRMAVGVAKLVCYQSTVLVRAHISETVGLLGMKFFGNIYGPQRDECYWPYSVFSPPLESCVYLSVIYLKPQDGLPWGLQHRFVFPLGWIMNFGELKMFCLVQYFGSRLNTCKADDIPNSLMMWKANIRLLKH